MNKSDSGARGSSQKRKGPLNCHETIHYLMSAEEQLLQSISARAPLPALLNGICSALDCKIGNVVSLISLPKNDSINLAAIAVNAEAFGLHMFFSAGVVEESSEELGSLKMYSSVRRRPSAKEFQMIARALCLAAIAIKLDNELDDHQGNCCMRGNRPVRGHVLEWPVSVN